MQECASFVTSLNGLLALEDLHTDSAPLVLEKINTLLHVMWTCMVLKNTFALPLESESWEIASFYDLGWDTLLLIY